MNTLVNNGAQLVQYSHLCSTANHYLVVPSYLQVFSVASPITRNSNAEIFT